MSANESTEQDTTLAGSGGDDVSAGTSVSGIGGEALRVENTEAGLSPVAERAARIAWGRDVAEQGQVEPAGHDGTGQSETPPAG
jgi:hypothetical protein